MIEKNKIYQGDCLELMKQIEDKSVDLILCDLPYGSTQCSWDVIIPFEKLWEQYNRIIKDNGTILLFGTEPFSTQVRISNLKRFKYDWVWVKEKGNGVGTAKFQPLRQTEYISVFYKKNQFYPIMEKLDKPYKHIITTKGSEQKNWGFKSIKNQESYYKEYTHKFPTNVLFFAREHNTKNVHPTQKPVLLCEYLIKTYTKENAVVLDNCIGSGTTAVACVNTKRRFIGFEISKEYCKIAEDRIQKELSQTKLNRATEELVSIPPNPKGIGYP